MIAGPPGLVNLTAPPWMWSEKPGPQTAGRIWHQARCSSWPTGWRSALSLPCHGGKGRRQGLMEEKDTTGVNDMMKVTGGNKMT